MMGSWNDGFKKTSIPRFHYSIIPFGSSGKWSQKNAIPINCRNSDT
jgi:hypothetical protein